MSGRQSLQTAKALRLVAKGMSQRKAAAKAGVAQSTIVRALQKTRGPPPK